MRPEQIELAKKAGIIFPTILPLFNSPPIPSAIESWIPKHEAPDQKALARKICDNIDYIPFEAFLSQLQKTVDDFNKQVTEPYILWIINTTSEKDSSGLWVAGLALEHCALRWPEAIVTGPEELAHYLQKSLAIKPILILDDAAYSGTQMKQELDRFEYALFESRPHSERTAVQYKVHIGVPFIAESAKMRIAVRVRGLIELNFLQARTLRMLAELLTEEESENFATLAPFMSPDKTITYFDHKFPDRMSTVPNLETGESLDRDYALGVMKRAGYVSPRDAAENPGLTCITDQKEWVQLCLTIVPKPMPVVPCIIPPYKLHTEEGLAALRDAVTNCRLGERTSYAISERYRALKEILGETASKMIEDIAGFGSDSPRLMRLPKGSVDAGADVVVVVATKGI